MGLGDNVMATGLAKGAAARGKQIAFGDGVQIIWDHHSKEVFAYNPNVAAPGRERDSNIEWVRFHRGHRQYATQVGSLRWAWNYAFKPIPGEFFFTQQELHFARSAMQPTDKKVVIVEPNVPAHKSVAPNKTWPFERFRRVAKDLHKAGYQVRQLVYPGATLRLDWAMPIQTSSFRTAAAVIRRAQALLCPEGGLHHAAAAVGTRAVVIFGGFIPPQVTGYDIHVNLTGGAAACGSLQPCEHCKAAMDNISTEQVFEAVRGIA